MIYKIMENMQNVEISIINEKGKKHLEFAICDFQFAIGTWQLKFGNRHLAIGNETHLAIEIWQLKISNEYD